MEAPTRSRFWKKKQKHTQELHHADFYKYWASRKQNTLINCLAQASERVQTKTLLRHQNGDTGCFSPTWAELTEQNLKRWKLESWRNVCVLAVMSIRWKPDPETHNQTLYWLTREGKLRTERERMPDVEEVMMQCSSASTGLILVLLR